MVDRVNQGFEKKHVLYEIFSSWFSSEYSAAVQYWQYRAAQCSAVQCFTVQYRQHCAV